MVRNWVVDRLRNASTKATEAIISTLSNLFHLNQILVMVASTDLPSCAYTERHFYRGNASQSISCYANSHKSISSLDMQIWVICCALFLRAVEVAHVSLPKLSIHHAVCPRCGYVHSQKVTRDDDLTRFENALRVGECNPNYTNHQLSCDSQRQDTNSLPTRTCQWWPTM